MVLLICCVSGALAVIMPPPAVWDNRFILGLWAALCAAVVFLFVLNATDNSITPWRGVFAFIASGTVLACLFLPTDQKSMSECLFCKIIVRNFPRLVSLKMMTRLRFLDIHPVNPGHTLLVPKNTALCSPMRMMRRSPILGSSLKGSIGGDQREPARMATTSA